MQENDKVEYSLVEKPSFKSVVMKVFEFVKKHWIIEVIILAAIVLTVVIYNLVPVIPVNETKLVNMNSLVRLESGQVVTLKSGNVSVRIAHFTNDTCPEGVQCIWSGQAVEYMLTVDGQKYATGSMNTNNASAYRIETLSSDYETYANIKITKVKE